MEGKRRNKKGGVEYYVRWKGWDDGARTWEPEENVWNAREALNGFYEVYPEAPGGPLEDEGPMMEEEREDEEEPQVRRSGRIRQRRNA